MNVVTSQRAALVAALVTGVLPFLAGCGGTATGAAPGTTPGGSATAQASSGDDGQVAVPADADPQTKQQYEVENAVAACMKKAGFVYHPYIPAKTARESAVNGSDYTLAQKYREKYGFGIYAGPVYPNDPNVPHGESKTDSGQTNPNDAYVHQLSPAQQSAYQIALSGPAPSESSGPMKKAAVPRPGGGGCYGAATKSGEGAAKSAAGDPASIQADLAALNGDSQLVGLAQSYASCLRGHGIQVSTTQPTGIGSVVMLALSAQAQDSPATMSQATALPLLTHEITLAMQDLTCGKAFRAAYFPKLAAHPNAGGEG